MATEEINLTLKDRIFLSNQYLILELICPEEAETFKQKRHIVENGYEQHYSDLNVYVVESKFPEHSSREVMDILDMYRALGYSYKMLEDKKGFEEKDLRFMGFDGNDRSGYLGYARFLVLTQGRWEEIIEGRSGFDLNSHFPVNEMYRRMLAVWKRAGKKYDLTSEELKLVIEARIHPENR